MCCPWLTVVPLQTAASHAEALCSSERRYSQLSRRNQSGDADHFAASPPSDRIVFERRWSENWLHSTALRRASTSPSWMDSARYQLPRSSWRALYSTVRHDLSVKGCCRRTATRRCRTTWSLECRQCQYGTFSIPQQENQISCRLLSPFDQEQHDKLWHHQCPPPKSGRSTSQRKTFFLHLSFHSPRPFRLFQISQIPKNSPPSASVQTAIPLDNLQDCRSGPPQPCPGLHRTEQGCLRRLGQHSYGAQKKPTVTPKQHTLTHTHTHTHAGPLEAHCSRRWQSLTLAELLVQYRHAISKVKLLATLAH